jgi:dephospho-CoA kinase
MVLRVAITGGIACGKSLFSRYLGELGAEILDADDVVHRLEAPGGAAVAPIQDAFGRRVIRPDGGVDRVALGSLVFADAAARERLNSAVHPLVREAIRDWLARPGSGVRVAVVPLLFEVGWQDDWDVIVCLASSEAEQVDRLVRGRGMSPEQARMRIAAQMPMADKAARAHLVVSNHADADALAQEADKVYRFLTEKFV